MQWLKAVRLSNLCKELKTEVDCRHDAFQPSPHPPFHVRINRLSYPCPTRLHIQLQLATPVSPAGTHQTYCKLLQG